MQFLHVDERAAFRGMGDTGEVLRRRLGLTSSGDLFSNELLTRQRDHRRSLDSALNGGTLVRSMWLIRTALRRPYTFVVMALLIAIGGVASIRKTPTDIFPSIDIPVLTVIWNYGGLPPEEMEKRVVNNFERF